MVALLTLVVLLPTACVLWFMTQAMQNERLAMQQKLADFYQGQLAAMGDRFDEDWARRAEELTRSVQTMPAPQAFIRSVESDLADSVIIFDGQGEIAYPQVPPVVMPYGATEGNDWGEALRLENLPDGLPAAIEAYARIAERSTDANQSARARVAQARCLVRNGQTEDAITILTQSLAIEAYPDAVDRQGRLIAADAQLRALQLMDGPGHSGFDGTAARLRARLQDYAGPAMPSAQRAFLMRQWQLLVDDGPGFNSLQAEALAVRWIDSDAPLYASTSPGIQPSTLPDVWELYHADTRVLALYRTEELRRRLGDLPTEKAPSNRLSVDVLAPGEEPQGSSPIVVDAGEWMPGWRLSIAADDASLFDASADKQITAYLWTGVLVIGSTLAMAVLIAWAVRRQIRVARLKNDIVATVSHELKTPLASMRLLLDTLLDADEFDPKRVNEYLHLISRENTRLSRLIENFLTFSRLEQDRYAFNPTELQPMDIVDAASQAVRDRFQAPGCRFDIQVAPGLPTFLGDADALVTAVVNLLDNAYKYSGDDKHITLRAFAEDGSVCFQVRDNGIGISRIGSRNVFKRFYQVDQSLSGISSGVGLGLSIVRAIVLAHHGRIDLDSEPGKGSTFTIRVPANTTAPDHASEARSDVA